MFIDWESKYKRLLRKYRCLKCTLADCLEHTTTTTTTSTTSTTTVAPTTTTTSTSTTTTTTEAPAPEFNTSDLTFSTNTNLLNTSQVFTANGGGFGFGHTGLDTLFLAANQNGRIYAKMQAGDSADFVLGFNTTNAQTGLAGMEIAYDRQVTTNELFRFQSGNPYDTTTTVANSQWISLFRVGPMYKAQKSPDGLAWTDIGEFLFQSLYSDSSAIPVYPVCDLHTTGKMYTPKIDIYDAGDVAHLLIQDGDSIAWGQLDGINVTKTNIGYQAYAALQATHETFYKNVAAAGASWATRNTALATDVYPLFGTTGSSFNKIIVAINCGVNQLATLSPAVVYASAMTYINNVLAQDSRTHVMVYTVINDDPAYASFANIAAYNALLLATPQTSRFKIVDTTVEPLLTAVGACDNLTYYQADKVHLTQAGYNLLAGLGIPVAQSF